jgi:selenocysteine lyase/cysteine desulfurase
MAMGIVYVAERHFETVRPTLLGAWNVHSPKFLTQESIEFVPTAQRYEPGVLNASGVYGMKAALELLLDVGIETVAARLLELKALMLEILLPLGFQLVGPASGSYASGITTVWHPSVAASVLFRRLEEKGVSASLRFDRAGNEYLRFSPHFYNTTVELRRVGAVLGEILSGHRE